MSCGNCQDCGAAANNCDCPGCVPPYASYACAGHYNVLKFDMTGSNSLAPEDMPDSIDVSLYYQVEALGGYYTPANYGNVLTSLMTITYDTVSRTWKGNTSSFPAETGSYTLRLEMTLTGLSFRGYLWTDQSLAAGFDKICVVFEWPYAELEGYYKYCPISVGCCAAGGGGCASGQPYMEYAAIHDYLPNVLWHRPAEVSVTISAGSFACIGCTVGGAYFGNNFSGSYILKRDTTYYCGNQTNGLGSRGGFGGISPPFNCPYYITYQPLPLGQNAIIDFTFVAVYPHGRVRYIKATDTFDPWATGQVFTLASNSAPCTAVPTEVTYDFISWTELTA